MNDRRSSDKPIAPSPGVDPLGIIRAIAHDLINHATNYEDKRAGRRILGALDALERSKPMTASSKFSDTIHGAAIADYIAEKVAAYLAEKAKRDSDYCKPIAGSHEVRFDGNIDTLELGKRIADACFKVVTP